ncbi:hypothetical protein [Roseomonas gilardii]|uniref:hypothetical protein n=1 Tax=Roseomonas gilardii TaxID=257708 RepID=UPI0014309A12
MFRVRLPPDLAEALKRQAERNRRSVSREVEMCVVAELERHAPSRPETGGTPAAGVASQA